MVTKVLPEPLDHKGPLVQLGHKVLQVVRGQRGLQVLLDLKGPKVLLVVLVLKEQQGQLEVREL